MMTSRLSVAAALACALAPLTPAFATVDAAADDSATVDEARRDIIVIAREQTDTIENVPAPPVTVDAERLSQTVNAINADDALRYLPSLVVRKRHIGDTQAVLATRTSGLGASARSLIFADGVLLSTLIGNNNGNASPRWGLVAPEEIERVDVLYGPFSAAYAGNSMGAVVNFTTRMPDSFEASARVQTQVQDFSLYGTDDHYWSQQYSALVGGRIGPVGLLFTASRTDSHGQPLTYITANRPAATSASGVVTNGGFDDLNRTGAAIRVLGAGGIEHNVQDVFKLKTSVDLSDSIQLQYIASLFRDNTTSTVQGFLTNSTTGAPVYSGSLNLGGYAYTVAANAFSSGIYARESHHTAQSLSLVGNNAGIDWQLVGTSYDYSYDVQRTPTIAPPLAFTSGAGQVVDLDGTGWKTLDGRAAFSLGSDDSHRISLGGHWDRYTINSQRYATSDWSTGIIGVRNLVSQGSTRTAAIWAQDDIAITDALSLTLGGRYEWWRAYNGFNFSLTPALSTVQPERRQSGFSPKATLVWNPADNWTARLSFGKAYRFPTVGELYQAITTGATITVPDPTLRPERALSSELAIERHNDNGLVRLSLFNEIVNDALISQSAPLVPGSTTLFNYVQNVPRTRARGVEAVIDQRNIIAGVDLSASVTYADAETRRNPVFPASIGQRLPSVHGGRGRRC